MVLNDELPMGRMMDLGLTYLARGRMRTLDEAIQEIASVTVPSIRAALERYPLQGWLEYRLLPEM
jgi:predicted Zn-dependent peptidase